MSVCIQFPILWSGVLFLQAVSVASIGMIEPPICLNECSGVWAYARSSPVHAYVQVPLHSLETIRG